jgi:hypothetical protein
MMRIVDEENVMKLFLITADVSFTPYMNDKKKTKDVRLVWANSSDEAKQKYEAYWESKSESHGDSYYVHIEICSEAIV